MNFFSKKIILILLILFMLPVENLMAININALYLSACKREVGIILDVDQYNVQMLSLKGIVVNIPRYEIIYMANYTLDIVPINNIMKEVPVKMFRIKTRHKNSIVDLVTGWPVDYTEENISFLTLDGDESVIGRGNIWAIEIVDTPPSLKFQKELAFQYDFVHPYPFSYCPVEPEGNISSREKPRQVFPQQLLNDPVVIKKELDRLQEGKEKVLKYHREQQFYPVPQVYGNLTTLGYWFSLGSRYGSSKSRNNNLAPVLMNEYSSGPFGYQHLLLTGGAPMPYSIHEEPQTQIYYRFKADYFHMAVMIDPNLFLIGGKYDWKRHDLHGDDDKMNSAFHYEFGFDYGFLTVQMLYDTVLFGLKYEDNVYFNDNGSVRFGITFHSHLYKIETQFENPFKSKGPEVGEIYVYRLNFETYFLEQIRFLYSAIYRRFEISSTIEQIYYKSWSLTNAVYAYYAWNYKVNLGAFVSLEYHTNEFGLDDSTDSSFRFYPKGGVHASLNF